MSPRTIIVLLTPEDFQEMDDPDNRDTAVSGILWAMSDDLGDEDTPFQPPTRGIEGRFPIEIGRFFKRFDRDRGVFVSNMRHEYPED